MRWVLFFIALPWTLTIGWGWVLLMAVIRAAGSLRFEPTGILTATWKPWAAKRWKYSTTLGTGIVYQEDRRAPKGSDWTSVQNHEHVHVRQVIDQMLLSLVIGAVVTVVTGNWILGIVLWWSGGLWQAPNFLTAGMRNGFNLAGVYRGSEHERAAYAQCSRWCKGDSWIEATSKDWGGLGG